MAVPVTDTETEHNSSTIETPLITQSQEPEQEEEEEEELKDTQAQLSKSLHRLECFLKLLGFCQCSVLSFTLSWLCCLLLGVSLPLSIINFSYCSNCDKYEIRVFELEILASQSLVAAISMICISHNLRKYGFLSIVGTFSLAMLPFEGCPHCFVPLCVHFAATQFVALLEITGKSGIINFVSGGDCAVSSIVEVVGIVICLNAAPKISHRAQGLGSVASRWHASVTCSPYDASHLGMTNNMDSLETAYPSGSVPRYYSGSDLESADYVPTLTNAQLASYMSIYHKRQAFGLPHLPAYRPS
ncbi:zinc finger CONSTANS-like protein [Citrus sinensis]|nr:zinc finger CONSTANS-like protein [Citrus sinensis]